MGYPSKEQAIKPYHEIANEPSPGTKGVVSVSKQSIVKNPPPQPSQLGKDGFYSNVSNSAGKL